MNFKIISVVAVLMLAVAANGQQLIPVTSVQIEPLKKSEKSLVIIDLRTPGEYNGGFIANAQNIDTYSPDLMAQLNQLDKNVTYLIYCRTKNRSGSVGNYMVQNGFKKVYQLVDGYVGYQASRSIVQ
jgi:rhodanese-related sulfurtransferase